MRTIAAICPTANRREFLRAAIAQFLAQDYPAKRLVVIEDGEERNSDLIPLGAPVDFHRFGDGRRTIGEKRNIGAEIAGPGLIAHWDDDDWHSPRRLSVQADAMRRADASLCGADRLVFYRPGGPCRCAADSMLPRPMCRGGVHDEAAWRYQSLDPAWLAGGTLVYDHALWATIPFPAKSSGEDAVFTRAALARGAKIARIADDSLYVARIHSGNTDTKVPDCQWRKIDAAKIRRITGWGAKKEAA